MFTLDNLHRLIGNAKRQQAVIGAILAFASPAAATSFDCGKASAPIEKMICEDKELRALDERVAARYNVLFAEMDQGSVRALRDDQRRFMVSRNMMLQQIPADDSERKTTLHDWLLTRATYLDSLVGNPGRGVKGPWSSFAGEVLISENDDGSLSLFTYATGSTGYRWVCMGKGQASPSRDEVRFFNPDLPHWHMLVRRQGATLWVEERREDGAKAPSSFCGQYGGLKSRNFQISLPSIPNMKGEKPQ